MPEWVAPAKLNFDLRLRSVDASGLHPLRSLVQTIDWSDLLSLEEGDEDTFQIHGADLPEGGDNLIWRAVEALQLDSRPRLALRLEKRIAVSAGLGGGSADAAATLAGLADMLGLDPERVGAAAARVGADVPFLLTGGTAWMEGYGTEITPLPPLSGFAVAVAVPPFELPTPAVYRRWDELGEPLGTEVTVSALPPSLRPFGDVRNDLTPAAVSLQPDLADWMADLELRWERPVLMSGSGPACFAFFLDSDEAEDAVAATGENRACVAAGLRPRGVTRVEA